MSKLEITGKIFRIGATNTIPSKKDPTKSFTRREVFIDTTQFYLSNPFDPSSLTRSKFENFPKIEFNNDKSAMLDNFKEGDIVTVSFDITGRFFTKQDGTESHFNTIEGYNIALASNVANAATVSQTPAAPITFQQPVAPVVPNAPSQAEVAEELPF